MKSWSTQNHFTCIRIRYLPVEVYIWFRFLCIAGLLLYVSEECDGLGMLLCAFKLPIHLGLNSILKWFFCGSIYLLYNISTFERKSYRLFSKYIDYEAKWWWWCLWFLICVATSFPLSTVFILSIQFICSSFFPFFGCCCLNYHYSHSECHYQVFYGLRIHTHTH